MAIISACMENEVVAMEARCVPASRFRPLEATFTLADLLCIEDFSGSLVLGG